MNTYFSKYLTKRGSQKSLANDTGWTTAFISQLKRGERPISAENALKIEEDTSGALSAEKINPEFFSRLKKLGWTKTQSIKQ